MQDRYAGDVGDYLKFGLLRSLVPADSPASLRLGVVWYRTLDEAHNADGKHIDYLQPGHRSATGLGQLDPDLYRRLAGMVASGHRSTAALADAGVLTAVTSFLGDPLDFTGTPPGPAGRAARQARRRTWLERALAATAACQLIFADPDNGIRPAGHREPAYRTKAVKHAYLDELAAFAQRGQSLIVYHHADRSATVGQQARRKLADLTRGGPVQPVAAVRASRGPNRLFLIGAASVAHFRYLTGRLTRPPARPMGRGTRRVLARLTACTTPAPAREIWSSGARL